MTAIYPYFLTIHIIFGSLGLFTGTVNLLRKKGGKTHVGIGTGQAYMRLKKLGQGQKPKLIDWILTYCMLLAGVVFVFWGGYILLFQKDSMGITLVTFGLIGLQNVRKDLQNYQGKIKFKVYWLREHIIRLTAAYIATLTAFIVVNQNHFPETIPEVVYWLLPTVILTPLIFKWVRKYVNA